MEANQSQKAKKERSNKTSKMEKEFDHVKGHKLLECLEYIMKNTQKIWSRHLNVFGYKRFIS